MLINTIELLNIIKKQTTAVNKVNIINFSNNNGFSPGLMVVPSALGDTDSNLAGDANFLL